MFEELLKEGWLPDCPCCAGTGEGPADGTSCPPKGFRTICMNCQFCEDTPSQEELQEVYYHTRR
jgi:hypothetical protein